MQRTNPEHELEILLKSDASAAAARLRRKFDDVAGSATAIVLFGTGFIGRKLLRELRQLGVEPLAFADNNPTRWDREVDGLRVYAPERALEAFGDRAVFVVTVYNGSAVRRQLHDMNCARVVPFTYVYWKYADRLMPYCGIDLPQRFQKESAAVREGFSVWSDQASREAYVAQLRWRMSLDTESLPPPSPARDTYFPDDLIRPLDEEVFVDCGAFDGDTIRAFLDRRGGVFKQIVALEPDPVNFTKLEAFLAGLAPETRDRIRPLPLAVSSQSGTRCFDATGTMASTIGSQGGAQMECARLDDVLTGLGPTYVKMDIEGAEIGALEGARGVISAHHPVLAICAYHKQDDLWRIPLLVKSFVTGYHLFLKVHAEDCWEIVCYAVPESRLA